MVRASSATAGADQNPLATKTTTSARRLTRVRTVGANFGIGALTGFLSMRASTIGRLFRGGGDARPIGHLHAGDQHVFPVLGTEDRGLAFLHLKPVLAERVDDVRLMADEDRVGAGLRRGREQ